MFIGYGRVSTDDQDLALQRTQLKAAGCRRIFEEKMSGATRDRPELTRLLDHIREQDVLVVTRLDRLARSTRHLLEIAELLRDVGAGLRSIGEPWADTTSAAGRMVLTVFAGMAEYAESGVMQSDVIGTPNHLGSGGVLLRIIPGRGRGLPSHAALRCGRGGDCGGAIATCRAN
jgi:hypothetical protein